MPYNYYNIDLRIKIAENIQFNVVKSISIESTIEKLSDMAKIELPREFKNAVINNVAFTLEKKNLLEHIKVGDSIVIEAGYNGDLYTEFEGYINEIGAEIPLVLQCEDEMYKLKKMPLINKSYASVSLINLLKDVVPGYIVVTDLEANLGKFIIERSTPFQVLQKLKEYGFRSFFKGKVLYVGMLIDFKPQTVHEFNFKRNIRDSSDLKYKTKESRSFLMKSESMRRGGGKVTYDYGNPENGERTFSAPVNLTQLELKDYTEKYYDSLVFDGLEGSIDSWGIPRTEVGDSANIVDPNYPTGYRDGQYFIEGVTTTIDESSGFKRQNKLSFKIKSKNEETIMPAYGRINVTPRVQRKKKSKSSSS